MTGVGDRIRAQQAGVKRLTAEEIAAAVERYFAQHEDCTWKQVSGCVYCDDHGVRLYRGRIPATHTKVRHLTERDYAVNPRASDAMRERWGK